MQTAGSSSSGSRQVASSDGAPTPSHTTTDQLGAGSQAAARLTSASATGPGSSGAATCRVISLNGSTRLRYRSSEARERRQRVARSAGAAIAIWCAISTGFRGVLRWAANPTWRDRTAMAAVQSAE